MCRLPPGHFDCLHWGFIAVLRGRHFTVDSVRDGSRAAGALKVVDVAQLVSLIMRTWFVTAPVPDPVGVGAREGRYPRPCPGRTLVVSLRTDSARGVM